MKKYVNGVLTDMTAEEISARKTEEAQAKINEIDIEPNYVQQRRNSYPNIEDQLDMLWHSIDQDAELKFKYFDFYQAIKSVKVKYPKNG